MKGKNNILSAVLLFLVIAAMFCTILEKNNNFYKEEDLAGDVVLADNIKLTKENWFNGFYAQSKEKYLNDHVGFHNFFIRLNNQISYSLFKKANAKNVIIGKSGFLYELKYLIAHAGIDYMGDKKIRAQFNKVKLIQDSLEKKGIHFALLFAPGKATFYPEYIPEPYNINSNQTNYFKYIEFAKAMGVNFYDFNNLFLQLKPSAKYPLYPKTGIHWSSYGTHVAFDSLLHYMERVSNKKLSRFDYSKIELTDNLRYPDADIENGMNLLFDLPNFTMAYPMAKWDTAGYYKPRVLTIADSYWMGTYFSGLSQNSFTNHEFWFYNKQVYNYNTEGKTFNSTDFDLKETIEKNDFIFIMATEATLTEIGWGFIEQTYAIYKNDLAAYELMKKNRKKDAEIVQIKITLKSSEEWFNNIKQQAYELNISVDSCIQLNAIYMYSENHKNDPISEEEKEKIRAAKINEYKVSVRANKKWLADVIARAKEKHISVDSCITLEAIWTTEHEIKNNK